MAREVGSSGLVLFFFPPPFCPFFEGLVLVICVGGYKRYLRRTVNDKEKARRNSFSKIVQVVVVPGIGRDFWKVGIRSFLII